MSDEPKIQAGYDIREMHPIALAAYLSHRLAEDDHERRDKERAREWDLGLVHTIHVSLVDCKCGIEGHKARLVACSCGFTQSIAHSTREQAQNAILYHRVQSLEVAVGMKIEIKWAPGT